MAFSASQTGCGSNSRRHDKKNQKVRRGRGGEEWKLDKLRLKPDRRSLALQTVTGELSELRVQKEKE